MCMFNVVGLLCGFSLITIGLIGINLNPPGCEIVRVCTGNNTCMVEPKLCDSYRFDKVYQNRTLDCRKEFPKSYLLFSENNINKFECSNDTCSLFEGCYKYEYRKNMLLIEDNKFIESKDDNYNFIENVKKVSILMIIAGSLFIIITCIINRITLIDNRVHPQR